MTHILKARLFECTDMRHRRQAPRTQRDTHRPPTSMSKGEGPVFRSFLSPLSAPAPDRLGWTGKGGGEGGSFQKRGWGWGEEREMGCYKRKKKGWVKKTEDGQIKVKNEGQADF